MLDQFKCNITHNHHSLFNIIFISNSFLFSKLLLVVAKIRTKNSQIILFENDQCSNICFKCWKCLWRTICSISWEKFAIIVVELLKIKHTHHLISEELAHHSQILWKLSLWREWSGKSLEKIDVSSWQLTNRYSYLHQLNKRIYAFSFLIFIWYKMLHLISNQSYVVFLKLNNVPTANAFLWNIMNHCCKTIQSSVIGWQPFFSLVDEFTFEK